MIRNLLTLMSMLLMAALAGTPARAQAPVPSQSQTQTVAPMAASPSASNSYILGPNDEIEISVFGQADLGVKTRIKADGTIIVPFLGTLKAADRTSAQLSAEIAAAYARGGYLTKPSINVEVTAYASKTATVLGSVPNAGLYPLDRSYSVAEMVAKAGGVRPDGANAVIVTPAGGTETRLSLMDVQAASSRMVQPGDTLFVPPAEMVYVYGQVNDPGAYPFISGMTLRQAMAKAGGPTLAGSTSKIELRRDGKKVKVSLDDPARPEDVLIIKEKLF